MDFDRSRGSFGAARIVHELEDGQERAAVLAALALRYTINGQTDMARLLSAELVQTGLTAQYWNVAFAVAQIHAEFGSIRGARAMLDVANVGHDPSFSEGILAIAAMNNDDLAPAIAYLDTQLDSAIPFSSGLRTMASAYVRSGQTDLAPFLSYLPDAHYEDGLPILARLQAEAGDLDGALATFRRHSDLGFDQAARHDDAHFSLERLLAEQGRVAEAVQLAHQRSEAVRSPFLQP